MAGGISGAASLWIIKQSVLWTIAALVLGAFAGFCIGLVLGPVTFPAAAGNVVVVKLGPGALARTLRATLTGAVIVGLIVAAGSAMLLDPSAGVLLLASTGCGIGALVGITLGYLAARP